MGMRLVLTLAILPIVVVAALRRPFYGLLMIVIIYFARAPIWGAPEWLKPVVIMTGITLISFFLSEEKKIGSPPIVSLNLLLIAFMFISSHYAVVDRSVAFEMTMDYCKLFIALYLTVHIVDSFDKLKTFYWVMIVGMLFLIRSAILQMITIGPDRVNNIGGQGGGANYFAMLIVTTIPFLFFKIDSKNNIEKYVSYSLIPLWIFCLVLTGSRSGFLGLVVVSIYFFFIRGNKIKMSLIFLLIIVLSLSFVPGKYWERMDSIFNPTEESSAASRLDLWDAALQMYNDHSATGVGPNNFELLSIKYTTWRTKDGKGFVVHSTYLQMLAEVGLQGFLTLLVIMYMCHRMVRKRVAQIRKMNSPQSEQYAALGNSTVAGLLGFYVCALTGSYIHIDVLFWMWGAAQAFVLLSDKLLLSNETVLEGKQIS